MVVRMQGTFSITTFGCQMNVSDSERIASLLISAGLTRVPRLELADVIICNTCSVRQTAEDRVYGLAKQFTVLKKRNPALIIALTGCMAGRDRDGTIRERLPIVDLFFPTEEIIFLPQRISQLNPVLIPPDGTGASEYQHYLNIKPLYRSRSSAYIPISNGCDKFCAYCVVPYSRGRKKDRLLADILHEVEILCENGCLEITLLGQTVNLYNPKDAELFSPSNPFDRTKNCFAALLWELHQFKGISRIHFTAPHPQYMDAHMLDALALPKLMNFIHLPVQSGSNLVLARMNRPYSREYYIELVKHIREKKPSIALGTDIIVGFSGETQKDFEQTLELYSICGFDISYTAMYSARSGTIAALRYKDDVLKSEKKRRWKELHALMEKITLEKNQAYVGKTVEVLVDSFDKGLCGGNSREMKRVLFPGEKRLVGTIAHVSIDKALEWVLYGCSVNMRQ